MRRLKQKIFGYYQEHLLHIADKEKDLAWLNANCDEVYIDKKGERKERALLLAAIGSHDGEWKDSLKVCRLNDLISNLDDFVDILNSLSKKVDELQSRDDDLTDWRDSTRIVAEFRRKQRKRVLAKARFQVANPGRKSGRESAEQKSRRNKVKKLFLKSLLSVDDIAKKLGIGKQTIYRDFKYMKIEPSDYVRDKEQGIRVKKSDIKDLL